MSGKRAFYYNFSVSWLRFCIMCTDIIEVRVKVEYLKRRNVYVT